MSNSSARGSWNLDSGITKRWADENLDAVFMTYWSDGYGKYLALNDTEARPETPHPYCVYQKSEPRIEGHHTGTTVDTERQIQRIEVEFVIHAKNTDSASAHVVANTLAQEVAKAYDPGTAYLDIAPDEHVATIRGADWHVREGDEEWAWYIRYEMVVDATYSHIYDGA